MPKFYPMHSDQKFLAMHFLHTLRTSIAILYITHRNDVTRKMRNVKLATPNFSVRIAA